MTEQTIFDPFTKTWAGASEPYLYGNKSVAQLALCHMKSNLDHICQISDDTGESYTYEQILKGAASFAVSLKEMGMKSGDMIVLFTENHHYMAAAWLGCAFSGATLCPVVFTDASIEAEIKEIMETINPKLMVISYLEYVTLFKTIFSELTINCPIYIYDNQIPGCYDLKPLLERNIDINQFNVEPIKDVDQELFMLMLSSSTTGKPKLIKITHKQIIFARIFPTPNFRFATTMKPGWSVETLILFGSFMSSDVRIIRPTYTIDEFLKMVEKHKANLILTKPKDIFEMIHSKIIDSLDLSSVLGVVSTGEHLSTKIGETLQKYVPNGRVTVGYGISDIGHGVTMCKEELIPNCVGFIRPNVQLRIVDSKEERLGVNKIGEIFVKAILTYPGYYKNDKLTKESFTADGFFKTGDMGYVDEAGRLFLVERKKFLISYRGGWINQSEIEKIVIENIQGITGVCVVDVEHKEHGVIPVIVVIPENGVTLNKQEIIKTVHHHYKMHFETRVFFVEKLPMTISGKYRKFLVRDMILPLMD